jgi:hypothetical protein
LTGCSIHDFDLIFAGFHFSLFDILGTFALTGMFALVRLTSDCRAFDLFGLN